MIGFFKCCAYIPRFFYKYPKLIINFKKYPSQHSFSKNTHSGKKFSGTSCSFRKKIFRNGIFFFFFFWVWSLENFFFFFSSTLHLWLTCQNTFKNHENLPTCILAFIEQDCEVSHKISKQIVRYRLSKIARTAEGVLLSPNLHL